MIKVTINQELNIIKTVKVSFGDGTTLYKHYIDLGSGSDLIPLYSRTEKPTKIILVPYKGSVKVSLR